MTDTEAIVNLSLSNVIHLRTDDGHKIECPARLDGTDEEIDAHITWKIAEATCHTCLAAAVDSCDRQIQHDEWMVRRGKTRRTELQTRRRLFRV